MTEDEKKIPLEVLIYTLLFIATVYLLVHLANWAVSPPKHPQTNPPDHLSALSATPVLADRGLPEPTTTTEPPPPPTTTTTEEIRTTTTQKASRGVQRSDETELGAPFWRRLANCESADGRSGAFIGYFQFSPGTAASVGIDGSETYEVQRSAAITWAARIHPNEGTSSGWPNCWWVALAG